MQRIVYLNGEFLPASEAKISVDDRGFLFGDGVYEVARYVQGKPRALIRHQQRLSKGLKQLRISVPPEVDDMRRICDALVDKNAMPDALLYWQITRGAAPRTHAFPEPPVKPTVYASCKTMPALDPDRPVKSVWAITLPDDRWRLCSIKSVNLLANVLASQIAAEHGAYDALLFRDNQLMEASARSVMIIKNQQVMAPPLAPEILPSVTRSILKDVFEAEKIPFFEIPISMNEVRSADEIILAGTGTAVVSVTQLDGVSVGDGEVGELTRSVYQAYVQWVMNSMD